MTSRQERTSFGSGSSETGRKRVVKKISVFRFYPGRKSFRVDGNEINFRPFERTEKAIKFYRIRKKENK